MRKTVISILAVIIAVTANAQSHSNSIGIGAGATYKCGLEGNIFWEHETRYHNAWEFFANGFTMWDKDSDSLFKGYNSLSIGTAWKPCVYRAKNNYGSIRIGASVGSDLDKVLAGLHAGYEHNYALPHGWKFYWQAKVDITLPNSGNLLRGGFAVGIKFPSLNIN